MKNIRVASEPKVEELRRLYVDLTGVTGLKIKNNSIIGYYVEVPTKNANPLLENKTFIHRQSVLNAVRFTTSELMELEKEILSAEEEAFGEEYNNKILPDYTVEINYDVWDSVKIGSYCF